MTAIYEMSSSSPFLFLTMTSPSHVASLLSSASSKYEKHDHLLEFLLLWKRAALAGSEERRRYMNVKRRDLRVI